MQEQLPRKSRKSAHGRFATHIHVLYREVPFILNITACPEVRYCMALAPLLRMKNKKGSGSNNSS